jgi:uncharacterized glyoxalase superfamily protein PhnB
MTTAATPAPPTAAAPARGATHAVPCLAYADAPAAVAWLVRVLGAEARHVYPGPDHTVAHAELWFGGACVMLGSLKEGALPPSAPGQATVYVVLPDAGAVDALHARAAEAGARIAIPLQDTPYGSRDFACLDPEGNGWSFGTYAPAG